jgi:hypothetical protein
MAEEGKLDPVVDVKEMCLPNLSRKKQTAYLLSLVWKIIAEA